MKGRPKKDPGKKKSARVPFVALTSEKEDYEWARKAAGHDYISEWIRATLNAEVARMRRKQKLE